MGELGQFRLLEVLGAGGMGVVFKAEDVQLRRIVALKVMRPSLAASPDAKQRFRRETQAAAAFEHDHMVTIYQVDEDRGLPFFSMQWLEGNRCGLAAP
jgi:serine/threonine protein kinase